MQDIERSDRADRDWPVDPPDEAGPDPEVSTEHQPRRHWSAEQKAQIVRELLAWEPVALGRAVQRAGCRVPGAGCKANSFSIDISSPRPA